MLGKNVEDQRGAVDHLAIPGPFQVALLHGRQRRIHDRDFDVLLVDCLAKGLHLPGTQQRRGLAGP